MAAMGHTSSSLALEVYARTMERERDTGAGMDALRRGTEWIQTATSSVAEPQPVLVEDNASAATPLTDSILRGGARQARTADLLLRIQRPATNGLFKRFIRPP